MGEYDEIGNFTVQLGTETEKKICKRFRKGFCWIFTTVRPSKSILVAFVKLLSKIFGCFKIYSVKIGE